MFKRILVANRGEIAVRVMRTCREMGISPLAVFSDADRESLHVRLSDRALHIGPAPAKQSYLLVDRILDAAKRMGADAIHPGYGFLAENAGFAAACAAEGIVFIGPTPAAIEAMGDKMVARKRMEEARVPVVPGAHGGAGGFGSAAEAVAAARDIGFPLMIKATAGGGGKGMRLVDDEASFVGAFDAAQREALAAFGNGTVYLEKFVSNPRHVEVQLMADTHGHVVHLYERDCSVQRRHQKVIEETPCPVLDGETRERMGEVAVRAAQAVEYRGAGTVEFLNGGGGQFYFLEMNTRLQVEHPITELCTGVDLVRWQILIADGQRLPVKQEEIRPRGVAIECRLYAEDPVRFLPSPGKITALREPSGPGVRVDSGVYEGATIPSFYDPMISKVSVWATDRPAAIARMARVLGEYRIAGIQHNLTFHHRVMEHPVFRSGQYTTGFIAANAAELTPEATPADDLDMAAAALDAHLAAAEAAQTRVAVSPGSVQPSAWRQAARQRS